MGYKVDYHIHTSYSDGLMTPTDIVKRAKEQEYDIIAITDHDGVDGIREAIIAGQALELKVIPGIELSTQTQDGIGLHLLGYHIDIENTQLTEALADLLNKRETRNKRILEELEKMGYPLTIRGKYIGKPTIARALAEAGYIASPKEAFLDGRFLDSYAIKGIKKEKLQTITAIKLIKDAGGIPVLAHPIQIRGLGTPESEEFYQNVDSLVKQLKQCGLKGLECYHPDHSKEVALRFIKIAEKYHLHITNGSDFHGDDFL